MSTSIGLGSVIFFLVLYIYKKLSATQKPSYPPSPPADPVIGHVRFVPSLQHEWFHKLREDYGNILYLKFLDKPVIVVNNDEIATELLEKRGLNYSDRPRSVMIHEMMGLTIIPITDNTKRIIKQRSLMAPLFTRMASKTYEPIQLRECHLMMENFLSDPKNFAYHIRRFTTAVVIETAYGHRITGADDPYTQRTAKMASALIGSGQPGGTPPDVLPFLKYVPSWVPGAWWSKYARRERPNVRGIIDWPFEDVLRQMDEGTAAPSFVQRLMEQYRKAGEVSEEDAEDVKETAATIYGAGAETTWSSVTTFIFAMLMHPDAQRRAQKELDSVLGPNTLPSFNDRQSLPFLHSLMLEILRYYPAVPLGVPHRNKEADIFQEMYIPANSIVIPNTFGINRDPEVYTDPELFKPERFLPTPEGNGEPYPVASFGYGRRVCPGRWLAEASIWIAMAQTLSMFDIKPVMGPNGKPIMPDTQFIGSFSYAPKPFVCEFVPRSKKSMQAIMEAAHSV